jgi:hypothetical protein
MDVQVPLHPIHDRCLEQRIEKEIQINQKFLEEQGD